MMNKQTWIYLDDVRTPLESDERDWVIVRTPGEFVDAVQNIGLSKIDGITFDHDLGPKAMAEYFANVRPNFSLNYENIQDEVTGYDLIKWLVEHYYTVNAERIEMPHSEKKKLGSIPFPRIMVHSANPIGSANIMGYVNNFFKNEAQAESCIRYFWPLATNSEE
jgi:hypothetical protein